MEIAKPVRLILFFLAFMALACPGCLPDKETAGGGDAQSPAYSWGKVKDVVLEVWGHGNDLDRPYMRRAFDRYERLTGNRLELKPLSHAELESMLLAGFGGEDGPKPDVFLYPGGAGLLAMNPDENFHDFIQAPWVDDLTDIALAQTICNGRVVGLPHWEAAIAGIIYNKKIFRRLGLKAPISQEEFFKVCEKLASHGFIPMYMPYRDPTLLLYQFPLSGALQDASLLEDLNEGKVNYKNMPEMAKIVDWYRKMAEKGYFGPDLARSGWDGMDGAMKSGRYAMMLCWDTWLYSNFTGNPDDFGLMPAFVGVPDEGVFEGPNLMLLIVNEHDPKRAAEDFIAFMADPFNYNEAFAGFHTAPVFKKQTGSLTTPQYDASAQAIEKLLLESVARPRIIGFSQLDAEFIARHMVDPGYSAAECLDDLDKARLRRAAGLRRDAQNKPR